MTLPRFDSDTSALVERARLNAGRSQHDLEEWIIAQLRLSNGMRILDLGCGTGKQIFRLTEVTDPTSTIVGVDLSVDAVSAVNNRAQSEGLKNVRAVQGSLDQYPDGLDFGPFDLILSSYAIYYASDMTALLLGLAEKLAPKGQLFVCGPGEGTNDEMGEIINDAAVDPEDRVLPVADFVDPVALAQMRGRYAEVVTTRLANSIDFHSEDEVLCWWRSHNAFRPRIETEVGRGIAQVMARDGRFRLTKNVLGVSASAG